MRKTKKYRARYWLEVPLKLKPSNSPGWTDPRWELGQDEHKYVYEGSYVYTDGVKITSTGGGYVNHTKGWSWEAFLVWCQAKGIKCDL